MRRGADLKAVATRVFEKDGVVCFIFPSGTFDVLPVTRFKVPISSLDHTISVNAVEVTADGH